MSATAQLVIESEKQLELELFPGEPWGGRSPRALTSARLRFIFKPEAQEHERFFVDPRQVEIWPAGERLVRRTSPSASTLIPLPRRL